jgi:hypothetical protein
MTAFLSGLAEPAAVLVLAAALPFGQLPKEWVDACLAGVGEWQPGWGTAGRRRGVCCGTRPARAGQPGSPRRVA